MSRPDPIGEGRWVVMTACEEIVELFTYPPHRLNREVDMFSDVVGIANHDCHGFTSQGCVFFGVLFETLNRDCGERTEGVQRSAFCG